MSALTGLSPRHNPSRPRHSVASEVPCPFLAVGDVSELLRPGGHSKSATLRPSASAGSGVVRIDPPRFLDGCRT